MSKEIIEQIEVLVCEYCDSYDSVMDMSANDIWENHINLVRDNAVWEAKERGADMEVCEVAALLHDIALLDNPQCGEDEHEIKGAEIAELILNEYDYPKEKIELIKKCILNHRQGLPWEEYSLEEVVVRDADAVAHLQRPKYHVALKMAYGKTEDEARTWVGNKIKSSYAEMSDYAKEKYKSLYVEGVREYLGREVF